MRRPQRVVFLEIRYTLGHACVAMVLVIVVIRTIGTSEVKDSDIFSVIMLQIDLSSWRYDVKVVVTMYLHSIKQMNHQHLKMNIFKRIYVYTCMDICKIYMHIYTHIYFFHW
jgi:hypothetical protein